jgi:hypothetical protein
LEAFLDINVLIRMDSTSQMARLKEGVGAVILTPNEARVEVGLLPIVGGDTVYMQQQNFSLEALSKRDQREDPLIQVQPPRLIRNHLIYLKIVARNPYIKGFLGLKISMRMGVM